MKNPMIDKANDNPESSRARTCDLDAQGALEVEISDTGANKKEQNTLGYKQNHKCRMTK